MAGWRYTLKFGKALRNAIEDDDYEGIIDGLVACFSELNKALSDEYDSDELERDLEDISAIKENLEDGEDVDDEINYKLNDLYDICDALKVWVGGI